ncbi:NAD(P)H-dependent oxidoreductase [Streptomyces albireticuli]|uniref:NAD(P)H-dependent oxidoreductase n=1 Tax=Streptomyces albireticuli TaxID=1940 RepID=UPI003683F281
MENVLLLGLSAPAEDDPFGDPLLRALSVPGASGVRLVVSATPSVLSRTGAAASVASHPVAHALRRMASLADGLVIAAPESDAVPPASLRTLLDWLSWPADSSPLAGKPVAVMTTTRDAGTSTDPYCEVERMLFSAGATVIGPRTVVGRADRALRGTEDGRVSISDPGVAVRSLFHLHRTAAEVRRGAGAPPAGGDRPWPL